MTLADEGLSGLEARKREEFNRMIADCRDGKIDRVLVKSTSRFARNTTDYIRYVRELLRLGISICFEKENIDTGKMTTEQIAQIYGAFSQMESTNHSNNRCMPLLWCCTFPASRTAGPAKNTAAPAGGTPASLTASTGTKTPSVTPS